MPNRNDVRPSQRLFSPAASACLPQAGRWVPRAEVLQLRPSAPASLDVARDRRDRLRTSPWAEHFWFAKKLVGQTCLRLPAVGRHFCLPFRRRANRRGIPGRVLEVRISTEKFAQQKTCWRWRQSGANPSLRPNSLRNRKIQRNFTKLNVYRQDSLGIPELIQRLSW